MLATAGQAVPNFWLGLMLIILFAVQLRWLPVAGSGGWKHLVLPTLTLASGLLPVIMRLTRSSMLDVLSQDYVRTARAKGVSERQVTVKHALRNALNPIITVVGLQVGALLGGAVVTESVFAWPGLGQLAVQSITQGDVPIVQGIVLLTALSVVIFNLMSDLLIGLVDPRVRYG